MTSISIEIACHQMCRLSHSLPLSFSLSFSFFLPLCVCVAKLHKVYNRLTSLFIHLRTAPNRRPRSDRWHRLQFFVEEYSAGRCSWSVPIGRPVNPICVSGVPLLLLAALHCVEVQWGCQDHERCNHAIRQIREDESEYNENGIECV